MRTHRILSAAVILPLTVAATGFAQTKPAPMPAAPASPAVDASQGAGSSQAADLATIEAYLNGLSTAQADFTFAGPDGTVSHGIFSLSRPAKLRFEYATPKGNLLIADGDYVIYYDAQQKEASNLPISATPLDFLLRPKVSLTEGGVKVTRFEHSGGIIRATLTRAKNEGDGSVTVAFSDQPMELRGWRLLDGQGQITDVSFANWKFGMPLDPSLFHFTDPNRNGKRGR